jgi:hypothetical protein
MESNVRIDLTEDEYECVDWICFPQNSVNFRDLVNIILKLGFRKRPLNQLSEYQLVENKPFHGVRGGVGGDGHSRGCDH